MNKTEVLVLLKKRNKIKIDCFCDFQACLAYYISLQCIEYAYQQVQ